MRTQIVQVSATGAAGTIFIKTPGTNGSLIINNNGNVSTWATYPGPSTSSGTYTFDNVFMQGNSSMTFVSLSTVTIAGSDVFFDGDKTSTATVNGSNLYGGVIANVSSGSLVATWGTSPNASSQTYTLDASTAPDYSGTLISSVTLNRNATSWHTSWWNNLLPARSAFRLCDRVRHPQLTGRSWAVLALYPVRPSILGLGSPTQPGLLAQTGRQPGLRLLTTSL